MRSEKTTKRMWFQCESLPKGSLYRVSFAVCACVRVFQEMPGQLGDPVQISGTKSTADVTGSRLRSLRPPSLSSASPHPWQKKAKWVVWLQNNVKSPLGGGGGTAGDFSHTNGGSSAHFYLGSHRIWMPHGWLRQIPWKLTAAHNECFHPVSITQLFFRLIIWNKSKSCTDLWWLIIDADLLEILFSLKTSSHWGKTTASHVLEVESEPFISSFSGTRKLLTT